MLGVFFMPLFIYAASGCQKYSSAMGTGPSRRAVSNLDLKPCKNRKSPSSSRGVTAKAVTPPPLQTIFLTAGG